MSKNTRIYLIPGLGADSRMYGPQMKVLQNATILEHQKPLKGETLVAYARRRLAQIGYVRAIHPHRYFAGRYHSYGDIPDHTSGEGRSLIYLRQAQGGDTRVDTIYEASASASSALGSQLYPPEQL
jgi:hypothetical protein